MEERESAEATGQKIVCSSLFLDYIKQIYFMLPCTCSVIDHKITVNFKIVVSKLYSPS